LYGEGGVDTFGRIFSKNFLEFLGAEKEGGVGKFLEEGGVRRRGFSTLASTAFDG
jgi:hypothetical protein